jgi:DNA-binding protein HU-alpha
MDSNKLDDAVLEDGANETPSEAKSGAKSARKSAPKRAPAAAPRPVRASKPTTAVPPPASARGVADEDDDDDTDLSHDDADAASGSELKKQELISLVVERADVRKKYAKPVVEAVIEILGEALAEGREMNLQPFGKLKVNRAKDTANARIIVAKIRQAKSGPAGDGDDKEAVADDND